MSWQSAITGREVVLRPSPLETDRFGLSFSRAEVPMGVQDHQGALTSVVNHLREADADVVVVRHPAVRVDWFARLRAAGRDLIAADTLIYWRLAVGSGRRPEPNGAVTARVGEAPEPALVEELVADMFAGYGNHYLANPLLDPAAALAGYVQWGRRSAAEDTALIIDHDDRGPVALATMETADSEAADRVSEIQLAGVRQGAQRQGFYPHVLVACEDVARAAGSQSLVISTQAHNTNVQRAWARYGFEPVGAIVTIHAVRSGRL